MSFNPNQPRDADGKWSAAHAFAEAANAHMANAEATARRVGHNFVRKARQNYAFARQNKPATDDAEADGRKADALTAVGNAAADTVPGPLLDAFAGDVADAIAERMADSPPGAEIGDEHWAEAVAEARHQAAWYPTIEAALKAVPEKYHGFIRQFEERVIKHLEADGRIDPQKVFAMTDRMTERRGLSMSGTPVAVLHSAKLAPSKSIPLGLTGRPMSRKVRTNKVAARNADGSPVFEERELPIDYRRKVVAKADNWTHRGTGEPVSITRERMKAWAENTNKLIAAGVHPYVPNRHRWDIASADADEPITAGDNYGKVLKLDVEGDELFAEYMLVGEQAQIADAANDVSICIMDGMLDAKGNKAGEALQHLAIVHNPALPNLAPSVRIAASGDTPERDVPIAVLELASDDKDEEDGHWRTINGAKVFISHKGEITKGPDALVGDKGSHGRVAKGIAAVKAHHHNLDADIDKHGHPDAIQATLDNLHKGLSHHEAVAVAKAVGIAGNHASKGAAIKAIGQNMRNQAEGASRVATMREDRGEKVERPKEREIPRLDERPKDAHDAFADKQDDEEKPAKEASDKPKRSRGPSKAEQKRVWDRAAEEAKSRVQTMRESLSADGYRSRLMLALHGHYNPNQPRDAHGQWTDTGVQPDRPRVPNLVPRTPMGYVDPGTPTADEARAHERRVMGEPPAKSKAMRDLEARREKRERAKFPAGPEGKAAYEAHKAKWAGVKLKSMEEIAAEKANAERHAHLAQAFQPAEDFAKAETQRAAMLEADEHRRKGESIHPHATQPDIRGVLGREGHNAAEFAMNARQRGKGGFVVTEGPRGDGVTVRWEPGPNGEWDADAQETKLRQYVAALKKNGYAAERNLGNGTIHVRGHADTPQDRPYAGPRFKPGIKVKVEPADLQRSRLPADYDPVMGFSADWTPRSRAFALLHA